MPVRVAYRFAGSGLKIPRASALEGSNPSPGIARQGVAATFGIPSYYAPALVERLRRRGVRLGTGASVRIVEWEQARVYPAAADGARLTITDAQNEALKLFTETGRRGGGMGQ